MSPKSITQILAEFASSLKLEAIPQEVVDKAKIHILDTIGVMIAMHNSDEGVRKIVEIIKRIGGTPESTMVGYRSRVPSINAAFANSAMAHSADYDDTHLASIIHPSSTVVPAALAVGEALGAGGKEFLEACIAGYEIGIRISLAALRRLHERGFHPTSVIGVFGAATASSKLLGLGIDGIMNSLGIAGSMASGIMQGHREGIWLKPLHPAIASHNAVLASLLAKEGIEGPKAVLEGSWGFFKAYLWGEDPYLSSITEDLGERWEILNISIKPYPVGHAAVAPIDAAILLREKYGIALDDIRELIFYLPITAKELVCEPYDQRIRPRSPYEAKFSVPYLAIAAIKRGWVGLRDFTWDALKDHEVLRHTSKVKCEHEPSYDAYAQDAIIPSRAKLVTVDGKIYEEEVINHRGSPRNPFRWSDEERKFYNNIYNTRFYPSGKEIIDAVKKLEGQDIRYLTNLLY